MEEAFQILDADYAMVNNRPVLRLFGKKKDGKTVCAFLEGGLPYFYILSNDDSKVVEFIKKTFPSILLEIKAVEKYLPIGYQEKKTKLLKVVLSDPSQVPAVRDSLLEKKFVDRIFEADILFKYRVMVDMGLSAMGWIKVKGSPVGTQTVRADHCIKVEKFEAIEEEGNAPLRYMSIDIETLTDPENEIDSMKDKISMISTCFSQPYKGSETLVLVSKKVKSKEGVKCCDDEKEMLQEFLNVIESFDPDIITGYNINSFDFPFILDRLRVHNLPRTLGRCNTKSAISKKFGARYSNSVTGRVIADVYELIKESASKGFMRMKRFGLGDVSRELIKEDKIAIAHSEITKYWNGSEEHMDKLIEYSRKDAYLALKLLMDKEMLDKFFELSKVSGIMLQDVLSGGEATRVENLLLKEFNKRDFVVPCKPDDAEMERRSVEREKKALKGALVLEPVSGLHTDPIVYLDFKSMYPSIIISYNICPTTLILPGSNVKTITTPHGTEFADKKVKEGIMPEILRHLITTRDVVKKEMDRTSSDEKRKSLDAKQYALKIMANAFYGYTGYIRARLYVLDIANTITGCGRHLIQKTRDIVEEDSKWKVVYGDTDSIMVRTGAKSLDESMEVGKEIEDRINTALEGVVKMKIESVFKSLIILTKKRYAGLSYEMYDGKWKEKIMMKGIETVRRDWCDLVSETLFKVLEIILKEQNPKKASDYVKGIMVKLQNNDIPIDKLVITKSISKPIKSYKGVQPHIELVKKLRKRAPAEAPGVGDRVSYVITSGMQIISERAEDPDYAKEHKLKVDFKYYMESQLLPPLERLFEVIGVDKTELLGKGKQMLLGDVIRNGKRKISETLDKADGVICSKCSKTFRRPPLSGKCTACNGELLFFSGDERSREVKLS
jgi:DNA polymerase I